MYISKKTDKMTKSCFMIIVYLPFSFIKADEILTGRLVAEGNTKEEVYDVAAHSRAGVTKFIVEEVKVMERKIYTNNYITH